MIKTLTKTDLETCIYSVRNAGDKERPDDKYNKAIEVDYESKSENDLKN